MYNKQMTQIHEHIPATAFSARNGAPIRSAKGLDAADFKKLGFEIALDAVQPSQSTPSFTTLYQNLQTFLPGQVLVMTAARKIDEITGMSIVGQFSDESIVQQYIERSAMPQLYDDFAGTPFSNYNVNVVFRNVIRFNEGIRVGVMEAERAARQNVSADMWKREAAMLGLEIQRNQVGFVGYSGVPNIFGLLNDPNLPSYTTVATGASGFTSWGKKATNEIISDFITNALNLMNQAQGNISMSTPMTLVLPVGYEAYLTTPNANSSISVMEWLKGSYPNVRVVTAPQFLGANGGQNVGYLFADRVEDLGSTDGGQTFMQLVPTRFRVLGVQTLDKGYQESYANATAGVFCKRPFAVVRFTGI